MLMCFSATEIPPMSCEWLIILTRDRNTRHYQCQGRAFFVFRPVAGETVTSRQQRLSILFRSDPTQLFRPHPLPDFRLPAVAKTVESATCRVPQLPAILLR